MNQARVRKYKRLAMPVMYAFALAMSSCDGFHEMFRAINNTASMYDTICTDTLFAEVDMSFYGTVGDKSSLNTLNLCMEEDTIAFNITGAKILGDYIVGDKVAVLPSGEAMANVVVDLTTLCRQWGEKDTLDVVHGMRFDDEGNIEMINSPSRHYRKWSIMNGEIVLMYATQSSSKLLSDTCEIIKLTSDSLIVKGKHSQLKYGSLEKKKPHYKRRRRR